MKLRFHLLFLVCFGIIGVVLPALANYSFGVRIVGRGAPMILIPGLKASVDTYNDVVAYHKNRYKCYVIT